MEGIRGIFSSIDISSSGLHAQRKRLDAVAQNLANAETTRTAEGGPYKRRVVLFKENQAATNISSGDSDSNSKSVQLDYSDLSHLSQNLGGVQKNRLSGVEASEIRDNTEPNLVYDPEHPDADERGYVAYPKIDPIQEMSDLVLASRAYEANAAVIQSAKGMFRKALEI